jgi:hypothetical protein
MKFLGVGLGGKPAQTNPKIISPELTLLSLP